MLVKVHAWPCMIFVMFGMLRNAQFAQEASKIVEVLWPFVGNEIK